MNQFDPSIDEKITTSPNYDVSGVIDNFRERLDENVGRLCIAIGKGEFRAELYRILSQENEIGWVRGGNAERQRLCRVRDDATKSQPITSKPVVTAKE